uniref:Brix domain-containing protein n=1 Tax=Hymenolepis diminuta TaxID=6216 RepID=A0A0R3SN78_HYMDI
LQLKRQARLRREFIYRRSIEVREKAQKEKKEQLKAALAEGSKLPKDVTSSAIGLNEELDWSDDGGEGTLEAEEDEYHNYDGEPRVVITTSRSPSLKLSEFAKELRHLIPNSTKINRGNYLFKDVMNACLARNITDVIVANETRGVPDTLTVSHLPFGPTAKFTLYNVVTRHDFAEKGRGSGAKFPTAYPQHLFLGLNSPLGKRVHTILKYIFPVPKEDSKRVMLWYNADDDVIRFRHVTYKYVNKELEIEEHGPQFDMRLYKIWRGPLHEEDTAELEWVWRPYMNTSHKRLYLSVPTVEAKDSDEDEEETGASSIKRLKRS